jgi:RNA polymerase sigma factor (sigma-70 family)
MMRGLSFEDCVRAHYARIVALGVSMTGDREVARDLAQETFLRLHRRWEDVRTYDSVAGWLSRVLSNLAIDHHRAKATQLRTVERIATLPPATPPVAGQEEEWHDLLNALPPRQRVIVTLYYADDRSVADIAAALDISQNTVKSALAKARDSLRAGREDVDV